MAQQSTQDERLNQLISDFKAESAEYRDLPVPDDKEGKRRILRSLMNVRMPRKTAERTLRIQDEYLTERAAERGVVQLEDIPTLAEAYGIELPFADKLSLWQGDITRLAVDAIVNAANSQMLGCFIPMHSCIDNCIHSFAGVQLRAECKEKMDELRARYGSDYEQPTAVPMLTDAYNLPAKKVIHIVGPIVEGRLTEEHERQLAACYRNTLELCAANSLRTVAFCGISTGVFHFPAERAAEIAVQTVTEWLSERPGAMDRVIFNVFSDRSRAIYEQNLQR